MNQPTTDLSNFNSILTLIKTAKDRLYWQIGKEVSEKINNGGWKKPLEVIQLFYYSQRL
jgi:hypothetical protein